MNYYYHLMNIPPILYEYDKLLGILLVFLWWFLDLWLWTLSLSLSIWKFSNSVSRGTLSSLYIHCRFNNPGYSMNVLITKNTTANIKKRTITNPQESAMVHNFYSFQRFCWYLSSVDDRYARHCSKLTSLAFLFTMVNMRQIMPFKQISRKLFFTEVCIVQQAVKKANNKWHSLFHKHFTFKQILASPWKNWIY